MQRIERRVPNGIVEGECDERFLGLVDEFVENFDSRGEVGASCAITIDGKTVVDIWGGRTAAEGPAWGRDTVSVVFSCTKGAQALTAHMAADRGLLDLDAPVAKYWPEFATNGKEEARVSMMLDHSVGLPHVKPLLAPGAVYDYDYMCDLLARHEPFWKPGTRNGYHGISCSWTVAPLVHKTTGKRMGQFFQDEVARPLGIDFWIGTPDSVEPRIAPMIAMVPPTERPSRLVAAALADRESPPALFLFNGGGFDPNSRAGHAAEIGAGNGISNARGLAGLYAPLANGGALNGRRYVGAETLTRMSQVSVATHEDATLMIPTRFSLGYMKSMDNRRLENSESCSVIMSAPAFGHVGAGGSIGFADPECRMSFGYSMNKMGFGILLNDRGQSLVDAAYKALGYRTNAGGVWTH
ncbi:MAG: beta-lactamase family protein [Alphaproteobacteria bacterium]|nr:beta-lactamase family protein [Alphaproteobacteria bacterium]